MSTFKVLSSFFTNLAAGWFISLFVATDISVGIANFLGFIVSLSAALVIEEDFLKA
ncbi:MAG: hypothetical protein AAB656_01530 [Patescibacteria group bacterium]